MPQISSLLWCPALALNFHPRLLLSGLVLTASLGPLAALELDLSLTPASKELQDKVAAQALLTPLAASDKADTLDVLASAQADYQRILAVLYELGYFGSTVSIKLDGREASSLSTISPPQSISQVSITVTTGSEFKFGKAQIAPLAPASKLPPEFATGQVASTRVLESSVQGAVSVWKDTGYPKVEPSKQKFTVNHNSNLFNAEVELATGRLARIGKVTVSGSENVRPERVVAILGIEEGKVYSPEDLRDAVTRLRRTDAFRSVVLTEGEQINADGTLPIEVEVQDQIPRRFGFGGEISSDEGATVTAYWMHRNLTGAADKLHFEGEVSGIGSSYGGAEGRSEFNITARYERPAAFARDTDFFALGSLATIDEETYNLEQAILGVGIQRYVTDEYQYQFSMGLLHAREETVFGKDTYTLLTGLYEGTIDYRDNALRPTSGYFIRPTLLPYVDVEGARTGLRAYVDARTYFGFGESKNTVIALRGQLGSIVGTSIEDTPANFLFYSGGSDTVRGFPYQSLGVVVNGETVTGGGVLRGCQRNCARCLTAALVWLDLPTLAMSARIPRPMVRANGKLGQGLAHAMTRELARSDSTWLHPLVAVSMRVVFSFTSELEKRFEIPHRHYRLVF
nr:BamA/TamA family outer membrane protein [Falsihalocynthiibacter arcticus]